MSYSRIENLDTLHHITLIINFINRKSTQKVSEKLLLVERENKNPTGKSKEQTEQMLPKQMKQNILKSVVGENAEQVKEEKRK